MCCSKLSGRLLIKRIGKSTDGSLGEEQRGFMSDRSCVNQIFAVGQMVCEQYIGKTNYVCRELPDFKKSYGRVIKT